MKSDPWLDWPSVGGLRFQANIFGCRQKEVAPTCPLSNILLRPPPYTYFLLNLDLSSDIHLPLNLYLSSEIPLSGSLMPVTSPSLCPFYPVLAPARGNPSRATHHLFARLQKGGRPLANSLPGASRPSHTTLVHTAAHMRMYLSL